MPVIELGQRRELFVDDFLIERLEGNLRPVLHQARPCEAILETDRPWEGCFSNFNTVIAARPRHRLYYRGWQAHVGPGKKLEETRPPTINLAESEDGLRWERVPLRLFEYMGSRENNIVWMGEGDDRWGMHGFSPFYDQNPACRPDQRWKAVGAGWREPHKGLYLMTSPDGIRWRLASERPFLAGYAHDSHNTVQWSPWEGLYRAYFRHWVEQEGRKLRIIMTAVSQDLADWSDPIPLSYNPDARPEHLYTNNIFPYPRAPHLWIGFPARYVERPWTPSIEALPELDHRRLRSRISLRYGTAVTDTVFMTSRDGLHFWRWNEAIVRPGLRVEGSWAYGDAYLAWGLLETPSPLPGGGTELSFYGTEHYWRGEKTVLRRYALRVDGFVSLQAPLSGGCLLTRPIVFAGNRLSLNFSASAAGGIRVGLETAEGGPISGFGLEDNWECLGDSLEYLVQWKGGADLSTLAGKPVRLRIEVRDADLYSLQFIQR
jgi:hypothetical protein